MGVAPLLNTLVEVGAGRVLELRRREVLRDPGVRAVIVAESKDAVERVVGVKYASAARERHIRRDVVGKPAEHRKVAVGVLLVGKPESRRACSVSFGSKTEVNSRLPLVGEGTCSVGAGSAL